MAKTQKQRSRAANSPTDGKEARSILFESVILEHNRNPRHYPKKPKGTNRRARGFNKTCNDELFINLDLKNGKVVDIGFQGAACTIATASASLMTEMIKSKTEVQIEELFQKVREFLFADESSSGRLPGKLIVLENVRNHRNRMSCFSLPWYTLMAALEQKSESVTTEQAEGNLSTAPSNGKSLV